MVPTGSKCNMNNSSSRLKLIIKLKMNFKVLLGILKLSAEDVELLQVPKLYLF